MDSCSIFLLVVVGAFVVIGIGAWIAHIQETAKIDKMVPEERSAYLETKRKNTEAARASMHAKMRDHRDGHVNAQMICPHCQARGTVRTKHVTQKKGISGGKAAAAVLTAGVSVLATGLSRKEGMTEAHCDKCNSTWHF